MHVSKSPDFWEEKNAFFYQKYWAIDKKHKEWKEQVMSGKVLEGPFGRSWKCEPKRDYKGELKIPWTTLTNYPVQGSGADIMMLVRIMAKKRIDDAGMDVKWISTVHDSVVLDTQEKWLEPLNKLFLGVFDDLQPTIKKTFGYDWKCPMTCESKYGLNMKSMQKFK